MLGVGGGPQGRSLGESIGVATGVDGVGGLLVGPGKGSGVVEGGLAWGEAGFGVGDGEFGTGVSVGGVFGLGAPVPCGLLLGAGPAYGVVADGEVG